MLVILSDLHLTDGTATPSVEPETFEVLVDRLNEMARCASWRYDGRYRPIERIDLVLLGDVLDLIRSAKWQSIDARPWHDVQSVEVAGAVEQIADAVLSNNQIACQMLRSLAARGAVSLPPGNRSGKPAVGAEPSAVPVHLHYMVGDHDWPLHLAGEAYHRVRENVVRQLGLSQPASEPFAHEPEQSDTLLEALRRHRVFARHGDVFDPLSYHEQRDAASIADVLTIEVVHRFLCALPQRLDTHLPDGFVAALGDIDHVRPSLLIPAWLDGLLARHCPSASHKKEIKRGWDKLVDRFLQLPFVQEQEHWSPFCLVDGLQRALKFSRRPGSAWPRATLEWLQQMRGQSTDSYAPHALGEREFRNRRARHIVFGHTHEAESVALDASYADGFTLNQMYFNAGTWRRVYRPTRWQGVEHEFVAYDTFSLLAFYQGDQRGGRPFEIWSGTMGVAAPGRQVRLDPSSASRPHQAWISTPPASGHRIPKPHFGSPRAEGGRRAEVGGRRSEVGG